MRVNMGPPKYAQVLTTLQQRIESGAYPPGSSLPSEAQLCEEFRVSRSTVIKALGILRQDGWIESQQGKGHTVRGVPVQTGAPGYVRTAVDADETAPVKLLKVGAVLASPRVASALGIEEETPVYERRRLIAESSGPVALSHVYVPVEVAVGTAITKKEPLSGGVRQHLQPGRPIELEYVTARISARPADDNEAELLAMKTADPVLCLLVTAHAPSGDALMAVDNVMPADRFELEDTYPWTE